VMEGEVGAAHSDFKIAHIRLWVAEFGPAAEDHFSPRCETIDEKQEKVNKDVVANSSTRNVWGYLSRARRY
jgi:hypothetical protein